MGGVPARLLCRVAATATPWPRRCLDELTALPGVGGWERLDATSVGVQSTHYSRVRILFDTLFLNED
jgi:hypothetical protein